MLFEFWQHINMGSFAETGSSLDFFEERERERERVKLGLKTIYKTIRHLIDIN